MTAHNKPISPLIKPPFGWDGWVLGGLVTTLVGLLVWMAVPQPETVLEVTPVISRRQGWIQPIPLAKAPQPAVYAKVMATSAPKTPQTPYKKGAYPSSASKILPPLASVDINRASVHQLEALPHVGPKLAQRIALYRKQHGPFGNIEALDVVKGIGPKLLQRIRPYLKPIKS